MPLDDKPLTPEQALEASLRQKDEADSLADHVARLMKSLRTIQKENGFAPRMELAYQRNTGRIG